MNGNPNRPLLVLLASHWTSMAGVALVTLAGFSWLFVLPLNIHGHASNPYVGLLVFIAIPAVFFAGLALIPVGLVLARRKLVDEIVDRRSLWRRAGIFFAVMTLANVVIGSQLSYRAVEHMETVQFCGQSCHVMKPEYTAHLRPPHQQVSCASCHIAPGATGWLRAKMAGTRQLMAVMLNNFPRPIASAMESNRLVSSGDTCEQCHARQKDMGQRLRVITKFKDDEANTRTETVLMMHTGGGGFGGIHGAHIGPGVTMRYAAADRKRQSIPWVEYRNRKTGVTRTYVANEAKPASIAAMPVFEMQCVDCHNRSAHSFERPDRAVDEAMARGEIPVELPFIKKIGAAVLTQPYATEAEAERKIPAALRASYNRSDSSAAAESLLAIYRRNVFPDLGVGWGTYPNNFGHVNEPGCFRCHDDSHTAADKKTLTQDCNACHQVLAMEETSPEVLKTLGLSAFEKK